MEADKHETLIGTVGWGLLVGGVIAWDVFANETLSSAYDRYMEQPIKRVIAIGAVAITGAHLLNLTPPKFDPIQRAGDYVYDRWIK